MKQVQKNVKCIIKILVSKSNAEHDENPKWEKCESESDYFSPIQVKDGTDL